MPESGTASEILVEIWHLYATGAIEQARQRLIGCWMFYMDGLSTSQDGRVALKLFSRLGFTTDAADVWASLPDPLIVYRAGTDGVAWTVDRDVASYLAREHALGWCGLGQLQRPVCSPTSTDAAKLRSFLNQLAQKREPARDRESSARA
jgi:hypothetical protein